MAFAKVTLNTSPASTLVTLNTSPSWTGVALPATTNWIAPGADTRAWNVIAVNWEDETREYNQFGYLGKDSH
jgi:hypothetical protein